MEGEARVLEQRVEAVALDRHRAEAGERVGGEEQEGVEAEPDRRLRGQRRDQRVLRAAAARTGRRRRRRRASTVTQSSIEPS